MTSCLTDAAETSCERYGAWRRIPRRRARAGRHRVILREGDLSGWFTVERLDDQTFAISEYGHWEQSHCYLVLGAKRAALIDSGLGVGDIGTVVRRLTGLPITVVTTHVHWDHIGGHSHFADIAVHRNDAEWLRSGIPVPLESLRANFTRQPPTTPYPDGFDAAAWQPFTGEPSRLLDDGDSIDLGDRRLRVLHTPGHSPGHICVHDAATGTLFTGDLLYAGTLYAFYPSTDPELFYRSVERIARLDDVRRLAPGHNALEVAPYAAGATAAGLRQLKRRGLLRHGSGTHQLTYEVSIKL